MVRTGEAVFFVSVADGSPRLVPVVSHEVAEAFRYRIITAAPPGKLIRRTVPRSRIVHFRWSEDAERPWEGIGPFSRALIGSRLAAAIEQSIGREAGAPNAYVLPVPAGQSDLSGIGQDIGDAKGGVVMAESTAAGWDGDRSTGTQGDWRQSRIGPDIPETSLQARSDTFAAILAACGIPASMAAGAARADGTQLREDYRRFVLMSVQPMADRMAAELARVLKQPVSMGFYRLWAHDVQGRATALAKLIDAGVALREARQIVGLT